VKIVLRSPSLLFFVVGILLDLPVAKVKPRIEEDAARTENAPQRPANVEHSTANNTIA
jgi:hypothetical protein